MGGLILYLLTLLLETLSVAVRFALVSGLAALIAPREIALAVGAAAGLAPLLHSLLVLAGAPSGHLLVRQALGGRRPRPEELARLGPALAAARAAGVPVPARVFTIPDEGLNAAVSGRTLYIYRELYESPYLPAVLAHELGHYNSGDGRLLLAIRALTVPGGFFIAWALLSALRWLVYGLATLLIALLILIFAAFRIRLDAAVGFLFGAGVSLARMAIIFAVGGVGPSLLGSLWRSYFIAREYAADAYAARLGYAPDLIAFFENEVLDDVSIPWYSQPTHPPTTRRVERLAGFRPPPGEPSGGGRERQPRRLGPGLAVALLGAALIAALGGAALLAGPLRPPAGAATAGPAAGPTPTLGLPRSP